MVTNIGITGALGRMGKMLQEVICSDKEAALTVGLEAPGHPGLGSTICNTVEVTDKVATDTKLDALIDFSLPVALESVLKVATETKCALVLATTGYSKEQMNSIKDISKIVPVCWSPNMALGVNLFMRFAGEIAAALGDDYNIEIVEAHHCKKKDSPSGTALKTAEKVAKALGRDLKKEAVYGREGQCGERPQKEIGIHAIRGGDIVGEHTVMYCSEGERIELTSKVSSRKCFAAGAVKIAKLLAGKEAGYYNIEDLLFG